MNTMHFTTKLGTNKGVERSRVWIEGARLTACGFHVGTTYKRLERPGQLILQVCPREEATHKVSGKGSHPIIDITGKAVTDRFKGETVTCHYYPEARQIIIENV